MTTKPTLDSVLEKTRNDRLSSDFHNIATALIHIEQSRADLDKLEKQLRSAAVQIEAGETPDIPVWDLYQKAQNRK